MLDLAERLGGQYLPPMGVEGSASSFFGGRCVCWYASCRSSFGA